MVSFCLSWERPPSGLRGGPASLLTVQLSACCHMQRREGGGLLAWPRMLAWRDGEQVQHRGKWKV